MQKTAKKFLSMLLALMMVLCPSFPRQSLQRNKAQ